MAFGAELKRLRKATKVSVPDWGKFFGIPKDRIYKWERRNKDPDDEDRELIESYYSMTLEQLQKLDRLPIVQNSHNGQPSGILPAKNSTVTKKIKRAYVENFTSIN